MHARNTFLRDILQHKMNLHHVCITQSYTHFKTNLHNAVHNAVFSDQHSFVMMQWPECKESGPYEEKAAVWGPLKSLWFINAQLLESQILLMAAVQTHGQIYLQYCWGAKSIPLSF